MELQKSIYQMNLQPINCGVISILDDYNAMVQIVLKQIGKFD